MANLPNRRVGPPVSFKRKAQGVWSDFIAPLLALIGIGLAGCTGCLFLIFIGIFLNLCVAYGVYWICLNIFGFPYPWPQVLGVATFVVGLMGSKTVNVNNRSSS